MPFSMIQSSPVHSPTTRSRRSTLLSGPTTQAMWLLGSFTTAFCGITTAFGRSPTLSSTLTNMPGSSCCFGLPMTARWVIVPVSLLTSAAVKSMRPMSVSSLPSGSTKRAVPAPAPARISPFSIARRSTMASRSGVVNVT